MPASLAMRTERSSWIRGQERCEPSDFGQSRELTLIVTNAYIFAYISQENSAYDIAYICRWRRFHAHNTRKSCELFASL